MFEQRFFLSSGFCFFRFHSRKQLKMVAGKVLTSDANVSVTIYDMMGKEVDRVMQDKTKQIGLVYM